MDKNNYQFDTENDIITITVFGKRSQSSARDAVDDITAYKRFIANPTEGKKFIVDFRNVAAVSDDAVAAIVAAHKQLNFIAMAAVRRNDWQIAFIDAIIAQTGKSNLYATFDNIEAARSWLSNRKTRDIRKEA